MIAVYVQDAADTLMNPEIYIEAVLYNGNRINWKEEVNVNASANIIKYYSSLFSGCC